MGRKAGVTASETRAGLLAAAAAVFARSGYEGASIADITAEAGLSRGAIYSNYESKAELFADVLHCHARTQLDVLLGSTDVRDVADAVAVIGSTFDRRDPDQVSLLVEAIVASKRDPDIAEVVQAWFTNNEREFAALIAAGQDGGVIDSDVSAATIARFSTMLALGSLLVGALRLPSTDHQDWTAMVGRVVDTFRTT